MHYSPRGRSLLTIPRLPPNETKGTHLMEIVIGILVGGFSRRMGRPKALIAFEGSTLLERTVSIARSVTEDVCLVGEPPFALPALLDTTPIIPDIHPGIGPIGGLEALLTARTDAACILLACDMPNLCEPLIRRLAQVRGPFDAAVCRTRNAADDTALQWHPCCGLYQQSALSAVQVAIQAGRFSIIELLADIRVQPIELAGYEARWVENWNTPDDAAPSD